jgi:uncharacterized membrane protein (DUF373 family)
VQAVFTSLLQIHERLQRLVVGALLVLLMTVVLYATLQFISAIVQSLVIQTSDNLFRKTAGELDLELLHQVFNEFLLILIGIELMETIRMYLDDRLIHVEVVLTVAVIAVAREAIDINFKSAAPVEIIGTAVLLLALTLGYYLYKKAGRVT